MERFWLCSDLMTYLSFAALIKHRVPLTAADAVTLTLAVARILDAQRTEHGTSHLPGDELLLLSNTGGVTFESVDGSTGQEETTSLAALLRRLLQLDDADVADRRGRVPGGLLVLLARTLGQIDLEPPTPQEFRAALARFAGDADAADATLSAIFWRAAGLGQTHRTRPEGALLPPPPEAVADDRRLRGLSRAELRRALRDLEREVFERPARAATAATARVGRTLVTPSRQPRAAVAAGIIGAMLLAMLTGSGVLNRVPDSVKPVLAEIPSSRGPAFIAASGPRSVPILTPSMIGREVFSPSFGPKGRTIFFHAGRQAAPLMRASMNERGEIGVVTKLLDDGAANHHVTMSPDGQRIAFDSDRDGVRGVYVADADGRNPRRISGPGYASVPSWSPDGRRIAFVRAEPRRASTWNVWIADAETGTLQRITSHSVGQPWGASWFPDGGRLAYSREEQLVLVDLRSGRSTVIASPRRGHLVRTPAVSPDGSRVVFQVHRDGVWMLDVTGMRLRRILPDPSAEEFVWSPNGRTIAYHARSDGGYGVWTIAL